MKNEATILNEFRLISSRQGWIMWRNNVGVLIDERGRPVRYGLANESPQMNASFKSADLIGIRPMLITPDHVGMTIGQFASVECKHEGWRPDASPRTKAQLAWVDLVRKHGGYAMVYTGNEEATPG